MPATKFDKESIKNTIVGKVQRYNGLTIEEASPHQIYRAVASTVRDQIMQKMIASREVWKKQKGKSLYYLSVEFLMGRSMYTSMLEFLEQNGKPRARIHKTSSVNKFYFLTNTIVVNTSRVYTLTKCCQTPCSVIF